MKIELPDFSDKSKLVDYLVSNKSALIAQKKSVTKHADAIGYGVQFIVGKDESTVKAENAGGIIGADATQIKVRSIINTTKLFDSHGDVHIDQLWNKSLKEGSFYLVNQHNFSFEGIVSDNVKAFAKQMDWLDLGINYEGKTQALVFDSIIDKADSPYMFEKYRTGKVKQHSVGMQYVKMDLAVNDNRYEKEYAVWQKYFDEIANKEDALTAGYFWAVTEAKVIEGSAVVKGSNWATPTQSIQQTKSQPDDSTGKKSNEPPKALKASELIKMYQPIKHI